MIVPALALSLVLQAPLRGRLLDERSGEPIAHYALELATGDGVLDMVSDATGRFATPRALPPGRYSLTLVDDPRSPAPERGARRRTTHEASGEDRELLVRIGPTYHLTTAGIPPAELAAGRWWATLRASPPLAVGEEVVTAPVRTTAGSAGEVWVRFPDDRVERAYPGGPWWLELVRDDGLSSGGSWVPGVVGIATEPLAITVEARAIAEVSGLEPDAAVLLYGASGAERFSADGSGRLPLKALSPGAYEVRTSGDAALMAAFALRAGESQTSLASPPQPSLVVDVADEPLVERVLRVLAAGSQHPLAEAELHWRGADGREWFGAREGGLVFLRDLAAGPRGRRAELFVRAPGHVPRLVPWSALIDAPADEPFLLELEPGWGQEFRAFDRRSRLPLAGVEILLDDEARGTTDVFGRLLVETSQPPRTLEARRDGWRWVDGDPHWLRHELVHLPDLGLELWLVPQAR